MYLCTCPTTQKQREQSQARSTYSNDRPSRPFRSEFDARPNPADKRTLGQTSDYLAKAAFSEAKAASAVPGRSPQSSLSSRSSVQVCENVLITERPVGTARHRHFVLHKALAALRPPHLGHVPSPLPHQPNRCHRERTRRGHARVTTFLPREKENADRKPGKNETEKAPRDT